MKLDTLLEQLTQRLKLPNAKPDQSGRLQLTFDSVYDVDIEPLADAPGFVLVGKLGKVAAESRQERLAKMLEANLLDRVCSGAFTSLDPRDGSLILCRRIDGEVDYAFLENELSKFVSRLQHFRDDNAKAVRGDVAPASEGPQMARFAIRA